MTLAQTLEWTAFMLSMVCVFCYGKSKFTGAIVGITTAFAFIVWGLVAGIYAASLTNCLFIFLHVRNLLIALKERTDANVQPR